MTERSLDELGPVDYLVIQFPNGTSEMNGAGALELAKLHEAGIIRVMDLVIIAKGEDGTIMAQELADQEELGELAKLEIELAETLAESDIEKFGHALDPGDVAAVLVYENLWAAPFASAIRHNGGELIANGRIPVQAIIAAVEADAALFAEGA